jgi:hypothetical protein
MVWSEAPTNLTVTSVAIYTPSIYDFDGGHLNLKSFIGSYNDTDVRKIIAACSNSEKIDDKFNAYVLQRMFEITASNRMASSTMALTDAQKEEINEIGNSEYQFINESKLAYTPRAFDIELSYSYLPNAAYFLIALLSVLLFFETLRRIFYYIILGSLFPGKKSEWYKQKTPEGVFC